MSTDKPETGRLTAEVIYCHASSFGRGTSGHQPGVVMNWIDKIGGLIL